MPQTVIPLAGTYTTRPGVFLSSSVNYDQRFINSFFDYLPDKYTQSANTYSIKRPGLSLWDTPSAGNVATAVHRVLGGPGRIITAFGGSNSTIFYGNTGTHTDCGTITGRTFYITEGYLNEELFYFLNSSDGTGWYLADNAATDATPTFTATTNGTAVLTAVSSTTNVYVGQALSGTDIAAGARVQSIDSATQITMTLAATGSTVGVTVTFTRIAKIISANFPTSTTGMFVAMDGYVLIADPITRRVYNSNLNSIVNWTVGNYFTFSEEADIPVTCVKQNNRLLVLGRNSSSFYSNTGNSSGSPFTLIKELTNRIGCNSSSSRPAALVGDSVYWLGRGQGYAICAWTMREFSPEKISSSALDRQLSGGTGAVTALVSAFALNGNEYMLISQNATPRNAFIIGKEMQYVEASFLGGETVLASGGLSATVGTPTDSQGVYFVDVSGTDGDLYRMDVNTYQDDSVAFTMTIQTEPKTLNSGLPFIIHNINLLADTQASGSTTLKTSADDYASFGTVGSFDLTSQQKNLPGGGYYDTSVAFQLTDSGNNLWRGQALVVDWEPA